VYDGQPSVNARATAPQPLVSGMNAFLKSIDVSVYSTPPVASGLRSPTAPSDATRIPPDRGESPSYPHKRPGSSYSAQDQQVQLASGSIGQEPRLVLPERDGLSMLVGPGWRGRAEAARLASLCHLRLPVSVPGPSHFICPTRAVPHDAPRVRKACKTVHLAPGYNGAQPGSCFDLSLARSLAVETPSSTS
jgi:hypothetical protein